MLNNIRSLSAILFLFVLAITSHAQPAVGEAAKKLIKPYKLLASGRQITIKSNKHIEHVMLWTTNGNRIVEQREINNNFFVINIPMNQKIFFLMIGMTGGKIYTEKIGIQ